MAKKRRPKPSPTTRGVGRGPKKGIEITEGRVVRPDGSVQNKRGKRILGRRRDT